MNIIYAILTIAGILLACGVALVVIYLIISWEPKPPKQWKQPKAFDVFAKADLTEYLDEIEKKIS